MKIRGFIWLNSIVEKLGFKHNVNQEEIRQVFNSHPQFRFVEKGHRSGENVHAALGQTYAGRYLIIFFVCKKDGCALILSARDMTRAERRKYEQK